MDLRGMIVNFDKEENRIQFYKEYKESIYLFVLGITRNHHMSEDITHDVFIKIANKYYTYNRLKNPQTWLYTIARNTAYTALKKNRDVLMEDVDLEFLINKCNLVQTKDTLLVNECFSKLNDLEREIVFLYIFHGFTHLEISKIVKIEYSKVRARYQYALHKVKVKMEQ